jgi:hypothetical protein
MKDIPCAAGVPKAKTRKIGGGTDEAKQVHQGTMSTDMTAGTGVSRGAGEVEMTTMQAIQETEKGIEEAGIEASPGAEVKMTTGAGTGASPGEEVEMNIGVIPGIRRETDEAKKVSQEEETGRMMNAWAVLMIASETCVVRGVSPEEEKGTDMRDMWTNMRDM